MMDSAVEHKLWSRVLRHPTDCWLWTAAKSTAGYGYMSVARRTVKLAHRLAYHFANGPIPEGMEVCHACDNPGCVRPSHLFLGTHADNMRDMFAKGRRDTARGERAGNAKLTDDAVREIRAHPRKGAFGLAAQYGVSYNVIKKVRNRSIWTHVE